MSAALDLGPVTFDDLAHYDFRPRRSATGLDMAPPRPPATANPDIGIYGFADATKLIANASSKVFEIQHDLSVAHAKLARLDAEKTNLTRSVRAGSRLEPGEASRLDIERQAAIASVTVIEDALAGAKQDLAAARGNMKSTLRRAAGDFLTMLRQHEEDAAAEARTAREKANAFGTWARDVSSALQHDLQVDDLVLLLGIAAP